MREKDPAKKNYPPESDFWSQRFQIDDILFSAFGVLNLKRSEILLLLKVKQETLRFRRLMSKIPRSKFFGDSPDCIWRTRRPFEKARSRLVSVGLIFIPYQDCYIINLPKVLASQVEIADNDLLKTLLNQWAEEVRLLQLNGDGVPIENAIDGGNQAVANYQKGYREKIMKKPIEGPADALRYFRLQCDLNDIEFKDSGNMKAVLGKLKNWLAKETDYKKRICRIIEAWPRLSVSMKDERGSKIALPAYFDFEWYYKYRKQIDRWLSLDDGPEESDFANKKTHRIRGKRK